MSCNLVNNDNFSEEEIKQTIDNYSLLTMELEISLACNYDCKYCYTHPQNIKNELSFEEITKVILEAKELGCKKIVLLGGEPTIHPDFLKIISYIKDNKLECTIFTNGSKIDKDFAKELFTNDVSVAVKLNSFNNAIMDSLTNVKGSMDIAFSAINNLIEAGYTNGNNNKLAISTVITRHNMSEIETLWVWAKDRKIAPYFETVTPNGKGKEEEFRLSTAELEALFNKIAKLDQEKYDCKWKVQPPIIGNKCNRLLYSCVVGSNGDVRPCVGVNIVIGNIRTTPLKSILKNSEVIHNLRRYETKLRGPCRKCENLIACYGCRGSAFNLTGDYLGSDPLCWKNSDKIHEIAMLPFDAEKIIPQKHSMRMLDELTYLGEKRAKATIKITEKHPFLEENNILDESAYLEFMAQTVAAVNGFYALSQEKYQHSGFIIGARNLKIYKKASLGDIITIDVYKEADIGDFGSISGSLFIGDEKIAEGELKVWGNNYIYT